MEKGAKFVLQVIPLLSLHDAADLNVLYSLILLRILALCLALCRIIFGLLVFIFRQGMPGLLLIMLPHKQSQKRAAAGENFLRCLQLSISAVFCLLCLLVLMLLAVRSTYLL